MISTGFRTCYPRTCHLDILNILSWRSLRKEQKQEGHSDLAPILPTWEVGHKTLLREVLSLFPEERNFLISENKGTRDSKKNPNEQALLSFTQFTIRTPYSFTFIKPRIKILMSGSSGLHFLLKAPYHIKCIKYKFVCFSPVNLCQIFRPSQWP